MGAAGGDVAGRDGEGLGSVEVGGGLDVERGEGDALGGDGDVAADRGGEAGGGAEVEEGGAAADRGAVLAVGAELAGGEALGAGAEGRGGGEGRAVAVELGGDFGAGAADADGGRGGEGAVAAGAGEVGGEAGAEDGGGRAEEEGAGGREDEALVEAADGRVVRVGRHQRCLRRVGDGAGLVVHQLLDGRVEAERGNHERGAEVDEQPGCLLARLYMGGEGGVQRYNPRYIGITDSGHRDHSHTPRGTA